MTNLEDIKKRVEQQNIDVGLHINRIMGAITINPYGMDIAIPRHIRYQVGKECDMRGIPCYVTDYFFSVAATYAALLEYEKTR